jgi:hypothetical protein
MVMWGDSRRWWGVRAALVGVVGGVGLLAGGVGAGGADADALCAQLRAQYGPSWPCISVPTNTPPPMPGVTTPTPGAPGVDGPGPVLGGDAGPGPGQGDGTPIVGGPTQVPGRPRVQVPATPAPGHVDVGESPAGSRPVGPPPGRTTVPAPATVTGHDWSDQDHALQESGSDGGTVPLPVWLIAGAAAVAVANPRARSLLSRGGSTRATVGPSRMVLIHDESSPTTYRFAMNVHEGGYTKVNPDGSATVYDKNGNAVRQVARPWAFDAAGRPQKTWYTVDENGDLIQHVEPAENALYPILADPMDNSLLPFGVDDGAFANTKPAPPNYTLGDALSDQGQAAVAPPPPAQETTPVPDATGLQPSVDTPAAPPAPEAEQNWTRLITNPGAQNPLKPGEVRTAPGQSKNLTVAETLPGAEAPLGVVLQRLGPDGKPQYFRRVQGDDGQVHEQPVVSVERDGDGQLKYNFADGQTQWEDQRVHPDGEPQLLPFGDAIGLDSSPEPLPEGEPDRPAGGQRLTLSESMQTLLGNGRLEGRVHERIGQDGKRSYYLLDRDDSGQLVERAVTGIGHADINGETVFELDDGTGVTASGDTAVQDVRGTWWVLGTNEAGNLQRSAIVDGKKVIVTLQPNPDGTHSEYITGQVPATVRDFGTDGKLIRERVLDPGTVYADDGPLWDAVLTVIPIGGWAAKGGKALWSIADRNDMITGDGADADLAPIKPNPYQPAPLLDSTWPGTGKIEPGPGQPEFQPLPTVQWPDTTDHPYPPVNGQGLPYPKIMDPRTGQPIPHPPAPNMPQVPNSQRAPDGWRGPFIREWIKRGYPVPGPPNNPFEGWEIHHIIPREFGGTNDFNNLIPLPREIHYLFTEWFRYFGAR